MDIVAKAWLCEHKVGGDLEVANPHEKATNPQWWTDAFPVYGEEVIVEITRLREENKRMREAIAPMVAAAGELAIYHYDDEPIDECYDACGKITCGDLRKAVLVTTGGE